MKYYLRGDYYFDIDSHNQLRIAGPQNHLMLGLSFPLDVTIDVVNTELHDNQIAIQLDINASELSLTLPIVTDIRTLRSFTEPVSPHPTYPSLVSQNIKELLPESISLVTRYDRPYILCKSSYQDEAGQSQEYGAYIGVEPSTEMELKDLLIHIRGISPLKIWVETYGSLHTRPLTIPVFRSLNELPPELFSSTLIDLYQEAHEEVDFLLRTRKTSGFEYGTIFPRDWIESADLGRYDLTHETVDFMYEESMKNISEEGEGWHEDMIGAYKSKIKDESLHIDRKMIDIEPKYILGLRHLTPAFITRSDIHEKLKLVGQYIINNATHHEAITFKKVSPDSEDYHFIGNWRDSYRAYPRQKSPLAPYDVNCVLYPQALLTIQEHAEYFGVNAAGIEPLIRKWMGQKDKFRLYHPGGIVGYSLALHGKKNIPLPIAHLDESYDLYYNTPSMEEVVSFAKKCLSPDFFYTPVGPLLVASDEEEFTTREYHGKVIWPKQSAFCVAGFTRQYTRSVTEQWPDNIQSLIKEAAIETARSSFRAFEQLGAMPELYYYDADSQKARLYTDQENYEGQMSIVQLWSSVGARRMIHDFAFIQGYVLNPGVT